MLKNFSRGAARRRSPTRSFESLEARSLLAADLIISEFMASNDGTLADEDGDFSDWIEIHNRGTEDVNLQRLVSDGRRHGARQMGISRRVRCPPAASCWFGRRAKTVRYRGGPLHTDFSLDAGGEYLALTHATSAPGGGSDIEVVSEFAPTFPQQVGDVSYGVGQNVTISPVMRAGAPARIYFPTSNALGEQLGCAGTSTMPHGSLPIRRLATNRPFRASRCRTRSRAGRFRTSRRHSACFRARAKRARQTIVSPTVNFYDPGGGGGTGNYGNPDLFPNDSGGDDNDFAIRATGTILIPSSGTWTFGTNSDDGVRVQIDGRNVINDDTLHAPAEQLRPRSTWTPVHTIWS